MITCRATDAITDSLGPDATFMNAVLLLSKAYPCVRIHGVDGVAALLFG